MTPMLRPDRMLVAAAQAVACALLAACTEAPVDPAPPEPPPPETSNIVEVQVVVVDREHALIGVVLETRSDAGTLRDWTLQTWRPGAQEQVLARQEGDHSLLAGAAGPLAWYLRDDVFEPRQWCRRALDGVADCTATTSDLPMAQATGDDGRALLAYTTYEGDGLLVARGDAQGRTAPQAVPVGGAPDGAWPLPLNGADALLVRHGDTLDLHRHDPGPGAWSAAQPIGRLRPRGFGGVAVARKRGGDGAGLVVWCDEGTMNARWLQAAGVQVAPGPPVPDCDLRELSMRLAVAGNGDAMLLWQDGVGWAASRWSAAAGTWQGPEVLAAVTSAAPVLAADGQGRFVAVYGRDVSADEGRLLMRTHRPGEGWLPPADLGTLRLKGVHDVAVDPGGRAVVAWSGPAPFTPSDESGSRLAVRELHLGDTLVPLALQTEGEGSVVSEPAGLACPDTCSATFVSGSTVTLTARPADGQAFAGWSGDPVCQGSDAVVTWTLSGPARCTARFTALTQYTLTLSTQGGGRVSADPPGPAHPPGTAVTLSATPNAGQRFVAWGGDPDCTDARVTMDAARSCTAVFEPDPGEASLVVTVSGGGRVVSAPAGLACSGGCQAWFAVGTPVVLTAEPPAGTTTRWGGACDAATGLSATLLMSTSQQCSVAFETPVPGGWQGLGGLLPGSGGIYGLPSIAADAQGVPTVAFTTQSGEFRELQVLRMVGNGWQRVGNGPLNDPLVGAGEPSLALDAQGRPLVAFGDARGRVQVRHWDGSQWRHLADDLSLAPGAVTSSPQIAFDGQRVVVALFEYPDSRARLVLLRSALDTPAWSGSQVDGVQLDSGGMLRLSLDATGQATLAYVSGSGIVGEMAPRVVQEGAAGWTPRCDGGAGADPGLAYLGQQIGFGLQTAPDGGSLVLRVRNDAQAVQAWRCNGSGAWALDGPGGGGLVTVDNVTSYLQAVAMSRTGPPMAAVLVGLGYAGGGELHAFSYGASGFQAVGPPLAVGERTLLGPLAVAPAAAGSPVVAYGVEPVPGSRELRVARFYP
jgi:Divergent InlB B-repeat domain